MKNNRKRSWTLAFLIAIAPLYLLAGCEKEQGPLEKAGEKLDETMNDTKRAIEDATD